MENDLSRKYAGETAADREHKRKLKFIEAGKACFGDKGFTKTTIKDICKHAELTERYFYESFTNKEQLLAEVYTLILDNNMSEIRRLANEHTAEPFRAIELITRQYFQSLKDDKAGAQIRLFVVLGINDNLNKLYQQKLRETAQTIEDVLKQLFPEYQSQSFSPVYFNAFTGAFWQISNEWVLSNYEQTIEELLIPIKQAILFILKSKQ